MKAEDALAFLAIGIFSSVLTAVILNWNVVSTGQVKITELGNLGTSGWL